MILHIKNMVCDRCVLVVRQQLENLNLLISDITLGTVQVHPEPNEEKLQHVTSALKILGFELIDKENDKLVEGVKNAVIDIVHRTDLSAIRQNIPDIIALRLHKDYTFLSRLFSDHEDITLEKFIIQQKVEKVKELLQYGEMNMSEIAFRMGYSSSAHLSNQFRNVTGLSPSQYKQSGNSSRNPIDKI